MTISSITHAEYSNHLSDWSRYRSTYESGRDFIKDYLKKFSHRETDTDFIARRDITYCPSHAKAAIIRIKNSIHQRLIEVTRSGGPDSYQRAMRQNVDLQGSSMNNYLGRHIIPDLLAIGKVGVYIDRSELPENASLRDTSKAQPYIYTYKAEDIRSWRYDDENNLISVLLRERVPEVNEFGLEGDTYERFRLIRKVNDRVQVDLFVDNEKISTRYLELTKLPFVLFQLNQSLLHDAADYQIALLNIASSDLLYTLKSNFPFYVEQMTKFDLQSQLMKTVETSEYDAISPGDARGSGEASDVSSGVPVTKTGPQYGRRYPIGANQPAFIHPSSEPLVASMQKQENIKNEIYEIVNLNLSNLNPRRASKESKEYDDRSLEDGLSYIGLELEAGEKKIADIFCEYEKSKVNVVVSYPDNYSLRSDQDRRNEAKELKELSPRHTSPTYQRLILRDIANLVFGHKISKDELDQIYKDIETAKVLETDPEILRNDIEAGLVSLETASEARGYPVGEVEKAKKDHAERAARIAMAQSDAVNRGVDDLGVNPDSPELEKEGSQDPTLRKTSAKLTRGKAKN